MIKLQGDKRARLIHSVFLSSVGNLFFFFSGLPVLSHPSVDAISDLSRLPRDKITAPTGTFISSCVSLIISLSSGSEIIYGTGEMPGMFSSSASAVFAVSSFLTC